jgi:ParB-like chromosome segregation protein Spo0J
MPAPKIKLRKLLELRPDPRNARLHDEAQVLLVAGLIDRFGWTDPMLVDVGAEDLIIAGHCRRLAAARIYGDGGTIHLAPGREHGGAALPAGTVPIIDCTGWPEEERRAYNIAHNRSAEASTWDVEALAEQLGELQTFELPDLGFQSEDLADMLAGLAGSGPPTPPDQFPEFGDDIKTEHRCPKCNYEWSGKAS